MIFESTMIMYISILEMFPKSDYGTNSIYQGAGHFLRPLIDLANHSESEPHAHTYKLTFQRFRMEIALLHLRRTARVSGLSINDQFIKSHASLQKKITHILNFIVGQNLTPEKLQIKHKIRY